MLTLHRYLISSFVFFCVINGGLFKDLPDYIHVCKRDPNTLEDCVIKSIEALKPKMSEGIPELDVPALEPFFIKEIQALTADNTPIRATGHNVKVTGVSNFVIKKLSVDPETLKINVRVRFPKLHFEGEYKLDAQLLLLPLRGQGTLNADAVKCDADLVIYSQIFTKDGHEYIKFSKIDADINIKDYRVKLDGLFNGDKTLGDAANQAINQNKGEFLKATKPHLEKTVTTNLLNIANKIVDGLTLEQLLPNVDPETLKINVRVRFPKLHFEGEYKLDAQLLLLPLRGQGTLNADAVKCDADLVIYSQIFTKDGHEYIKFSKIDADINIKDYRVKLDGLFNGDKTLGDAANQAINQNKGEFLKATKPHLEKTVTTNLLNIANKIVDGLTLEQLLPKP